MLKSDLVNLLVLEKGLSQKHAEEAIESIFGSMKSALVRGENIEIRGLGAFHVRAYKGYTGRNPKTSEPITVPAKRGVLFRTGKELRERMGRFDERRAGTDARSDDAEPNLRKRAPREDAAQDTSA